MPSQTDILQESINSRYSSYISNFYFFLLFYQKVSFALSEYNFKQMIINLELFFKIIYLTEFSYFSDFVLMLDINLNLI